MKRIYLLLILCANSAIAQGTLLFNWRGDSNDFQASLLIPAWSYEPGTSWGTNITDVMRETALVEDPFGNWFSITNAIVNAAGAVDANYNWAFRLDVRNPVTGWEVYLGGESNPISDGVTEWNIFTSGGASESGHWDQTPYIPEPGIWSLLMLGFISLRLARRSFLRRG